MKAAKVSYFNYSKKWIVLKEIVTQVRWEKGILDTYRFYSSQVPVKFGTFESQACIMKLIRNPGNILVLI